MKQGLILVDIQNDYFEGGSMTLRGMDEASNNARRILDRFRSDGAPLFHIQHLSIRPGASFFIPGTEGAEIHESVKPAEGEIVVEKHFPNSFRDTPLLEKLKSEDVEEVVICGAMSHMCIDATTRAAFDLGFRCVVIDDACATRDLLYAKRTLPAADVHAAFMAALAVPYAVLSSAQAFLK